uniref:O-succinylbenzoate--CoA ligase n=1 Tax=Paulinella chromatophora TaxID=39717 RepID=B1X4A7_PAUCH|nr:O-succinylbenzoate--CoA ligase [Paulinella chromatophora]ACB42776.1 O-succinylbenzoate--CoA ligase [Paulinella chromatophora]
MIVTFLIGNSNNINDCEDLALALSAAWTREEWVGLVHPREQDSWWTAIGSINNTKLPSGPGVILGSGGSTGGRRWCLQPLAHLQASAQATGQWLSNIGLNPALVSHFNPLPMHHISGFMPLVRSMEWGSKSIHLSSKVMQVETSERVVIKNNASVISLVPTQLDRLLNTKNGINWLQQFEVIWVGGAALLPLQSARARHENIKLAPCYGATETAAMICTISPDSFLNKSTEFLKPLADVEIRLNPITTAVEVASKRLSPGWIKDGKFHCLEAPNGWWRSGDGATITEEGLRIEGRLDNAINSGGEIVFPEQLELRLKKVEKIGLIDIMIISLPHSQWGEELIALINHNVQNSDEVIKTLKRLVQDWPSAEKPKRWIFCPDLAPSSAGKWNRSHWRDWITSHEIL